MAYEDRYPIEVPGYPGAAVRLPPDLAQRAGLTRPNLPLPAGALAQNSEYPSVFDPELPEYPSVFDPELPDLTGATLQVTTPSSPTRQAPPPSEPVEKVIEQQLGFRPTMPAGYAAGEPKRSPGDLVPVSIPGRRQAARQAPPGAQQEEPRFRSSAEAKAAWASGDTSVSARDIQEAEDWETIMAPRRQAYIPGTPDTFPLAKRTKTYSPEGGVSPETREAIEQSIRDEAAARSQKVNAEGAAARAKAAADERQFYEDRMQAERDRARRVKVDEQMRRLRSEQARAIDGAEKGIVNPWENKDAGAKFFAILGIALGEIGRGLTRGERNIPLEMVNAAVEEDIARQRANMENAKDRAQLQGNRLAQLQDLYGSPEAAEAALSAQLRAAMVGQTQAALLRKNVGDDVAAKIAAINAEQDRLIAEETAKSEALARPVVEEVEMLKEGRPGQVVNLGPSDKDRQAALDRQAKASEQGRYSVGLGGDISDSVKQKTINERIAREVQLSFGPDAGTRVFAQTVSEAEKLRAADAERSRIISVIDRVTQLVKERENKMPFLPSTNRLDNEILTLVSDALGPVRAQSGSGAVLTGPEITAVNRLTGGTVAREGIFDTLSTFLGTTTETQVQQLEDAVGVMKAAQEAALKNVSIRPDRFEPLRVATPETVRR